MSQAVNTARDSLPRGPHGLTREQVATSQRARLLAAVTRLLAERGYGGVTIGELVSLAGVSRGAFYEQFASKEECLLAAYDRFATDLLAAMTAGVGDDVPWEEFIATTLDAYLGALERDPMAARAFIVEMDAAGERARARRRAAMHGFAALFAERHRAIRAQNPELGELPERIFLGLTLGVRELVHERLELEPSPRLSDLQDDVVLWITAMVEGAAKSEGRRRGRASERHRGPRAAGA